MKQLVRVKNNVKDVIKHLNQVNSVINAAGLFEK